MVCYEGFYAQAPVRNSTQKRDVGDGAGKKTPYVETLGLKSEFEKEEADQEDGFYEKSDSEELTSTNVNSGAYSATSLKKNGSVRKDSEDSGNSRESEIIAKSGIGDVSSGIAEDSDITGEDGSAEAYKEKIKKEAALRLELQANLRQREIERLAAENTARNNKLFLYPQSAEPDQDIEIFFNRSLSTLSNESEVLLMGAFNDWRWRSFTVRLNKTHLSGDWRSCLVHIPKQAYKMDFVFYNGRSVYDNNDKKDFCIPVEGGMMDPSAFEHFLLEEKRKELEKLAREEAERERQTEVLRRSEAEKAAIEAYKAQAKVELQKKRESLQNLLKNARRSLPNFWYIEPSESKAMTW